MQAATTFSPYLRLEAKKRRTEEPRLTGVQAARLAGVLSLSLWGLIGAAVWQLLG